MFGDDDVVGDGHAGLGYRCYMKLQGTQALWASDVERKSVILECWAPIALRLALNLSVAYGRVKMGMDRPEGMRASLI
ncbi:hypothetical protein ACHAXS_012806, partial [Conticribra weissflogii]